LIRDVDIEKSRMSQQSLEQVERDGWFPDKSTAAQAQRPVHGKKQRVCRMAVVMRNKVKTPLNGLWGALCIYSTHNGAT
jgi:hypothetical protein